MAYRLSAGQPLSDELRRVVFEEIDSAINHLTKRKDKDRDKSIHEARKSVKKLRGLLRLVTPLIGKKTYRKENGHLRDIGRKLSDLRDARAVMETFEAVVKETEPRKALPEDLTQSIRGRLEKHKSETEQALDVEGTLNSAVAALQTVREHAHSYQLDVSGFEGLERGFKSIYRRGRKAMKQARRNPVSEEFHNWRKRVKDHWYHVRLLSGLNTAFADTREGDLNRLETWLGDDHNLVVLQGIIGNGHAGFRDSKQIREFLSVTEQHGQQLREKAMALGQDLYRFKVKQLWRELAMKGASSDESVNVQVDGGPLAASSNGAKQPKKKAGSVPSRQSRVKAGA